jgi:hypothetical protein
MKWLRHARRNGLFVMAFQLGTALFSASFAPSAVCQTRSEGGKTMIAPYSATQWTTTTDLNPDGSLVTHTRRVDVARTSTGRALRIAYEPSVGSAHDLSTSPVLVVIHDPSQNTTTIVNPASHTVNIRAMLPHPHSLTGSPASSDSASATTSASNKTVSLGNGLINGINTAGSRRIYTVPAPAGTTTNNVIVTEEIWFSRDLHTVVKSEMHDTLNRSQAMLLDNIQLSEPDPALFIVPSDYVTTRK